MPMTLPLPVLSAWDPRAASAGSIDPLGALRAYTAIAQYLVPGATTITTRVRYLSWLCAGLYLLDECADAPSGGTAGRSRRQRLLAWERFLALATTYYGTSAQLGIDAPAWTGLRGISYVRRAAEQGRTTTEFELLRNQAGVGGVGTYWVTLVHGGLVENLSGELTARGRLLAEQFLKPIGADLRSRLKQVLQGRTPSFDRDELARWGKQLSLDVGQASRLEIQALRDALLEPRTQRRLYEAMAPSKTMGSSHKAFGQFEQRLKKLRDPEATVMAEVMQLTRAFEAVHAGLLDRFDRLLSLDAKGAPVQRATAAGSLMAFQALSESGRALGDLLGSLRNVPGEVATPARHFLASVQAILAAQPGDALLVELCRHHERVQSGKLDAARQPKQAWLALQGNTLVISPRFALDAPPEVRDPDDFTHPYRIESFSGMLRELPEKGVAA